MVGHIYCSSFLEGNWYYLWLLLLNLKVSGGLYNLWMVNGIVHPFFSSSSIASSWPHICTTNYHWGRPLLGQVTPHSNWCSVSYWFTVFEPIPKGCSNSSSNTYLMTPHTYYKPSIHLSQLHPKLLPALDLINKILNNMEKIQQCWITAPWSSISCCIHNIQHLFWGHGTSGQGASTPKYFTPQLTTGALLPWFVLAQT